MQRKRRQFDRRNFLKVSAGLTCGLAGAGLFPLQNLARAQSSEVEQGPNIFGPRDGFSPQVGTLVSMLTWMRGPVLSSVQGLGNAELDYLHDAKANTIGALLLHLAAIERLYQINTFDGRKWNDWDEKTRKRWDVPAGLGEEARKTIKGHNLAYYLDALKEVREATLAELKKRDDAWLMRVDRDWAWGPTNNYCKWFHVCEHESNHNGQIKWLKARLPNSSGQDLG